MIPHLIKRVFRFKGFSKLTDHKIIEAKKFGLTRQQISQAALKVIHQLQQQGYLAYVVGGAVRDLLLGHDPKDFDVATNATPEETCALFRRARIIGKRFRIVHVPLQNEIIEVSTFRGGAAVLTDPQGRILQDNVFGNIQEDAKRRDFTCNALYYDPFKEIVIDYHHGFADLKRKKLVIIGDSIQRYREDPVRILRTIRFAAKIGLIDIDSEIQNAISSCATLLNNIPQARLFDEVLKILQCGHAWQCLLMMGQAGLYPHFFPLFEVIFSQAENRTFLENTLRNTDSRVKRGQPISPSFLLATLLWYQLKQNWENRMQTGEPRIPALFCAMHDVLAVQTGFTIPRRFSTPMKEIWMLQPRFEQRSHIRATRLLAHPQFRAAYDFLVLRASVDISLQSLATWWEAFQTATPSERTQLLSQIKPQPKRKRRNATSRKRMHVKENGTTI